MLRLITDALRFLGSVRDARTGLKGKGWYRSKTLWVNFFTFWGIISAKYFKVEVNGELLIALLACVNYILRLVTNEPTGFIDK